VGRQAGNHPLAFRMGAIAFLSYNVSLGCMYGSFGVLVKAVEAKFGITRELSSLGLPLVNLGIAIMAPVVGVLVAKFSIRLLMLAGVAMNLVAYVVLALSSSAIVNLFAYGLLIGPGLACTATVLPATLVARWYRVHRGRAFGLVSMPIIQAILPFVATGSLRAFGLSATYGVLAALMALLLLPLLFVVDFPPDNVTPSREASVANAVADSDLSIGELLRRRRFWALSIGWAAGSMSATVAAAHLVPMTQDWGLGPTQAASLSTASFVGAMAGTLVFGWIAEHIGGARAIALACLNSAILWGIMLLQPPYGLLLVVVALLGVHAGAVVPAFSMAVSEYFGHKTFGRALGLGHLVGLPLNFLAVPIAAHVFTQTGSYAGAVLGLSCFLLLTALFAATARGAKPASATV
jgi:MFS family permease